MEFNKQNDQLQMQHLAGYNIVSRPPLYSPNGEFLFVISDITINVYSTNTGEIARKLEGAENRLIAMEFELTQQHILVACSEAGELLRWSWSTGELKSRLNINLPKGRFTSFNLIKLYGNSETACAFVTVKYIGSPLKWFAVETSEGRTLNVACSLMLKQVDPMVAVDNKHFQNIVVAQGFYVYFINYANWRWKRFKNAHNVNITVVRVHPTEEVVATGDEKGRIFLWRQFTDQHTVKTSLYHWHHTPITSIAFSASGASFYSGGLEKVLVKWNVQHPEQRDFIPRMSSTIKHIAVSGDNSQIAVCTADNGVQIVGSDCVIKSTLQEFTYVLDDNTGKGKFPIGLRLNPRTNSLVLNGRTGHLQFYSAYTQHLLYNMDIVVQNSLSFEVGKILYDICVTKAAFNIDWMATGEVFNDEEHFPELRLKFWKYEVESKSYVLNTNIELPHEGGFKAIEFSSEYQMENLLCATVGEENTVKIWALEKSDNIYKEGKVWYCIAQTSYKNLPIESISFSQDGSLLAAGFGNTLCIYKADCLKLKAALSSSAGLDGCLQKVQVCVPKENANGSKNDLNEQRTKLLKLSANFFENNDEALIKEIEKSVKLNKKARMPKSPKQTIKIEEKQKQYLFNKILQMHELNLYQKLLVYQKLNIKCQVHPQCQAKMVEYLKNTVATSGLCDKASKLHQRIHRINMRDRFKAKYRLHQYRIRKRNYDTKITRHLVPIMCVLNLNEVTNQKQSKLPHKEKDVKPPEDEEILNTNDSPVQSVAKISHVQFAAGEHAHLVVVCTETRVLVWNLLNLRLKSVCKLSVKNLTFDAQSNLIAAFTWKNELHIFQPHVPLPIYQRCSLPEIYGATWLPRRHPKQCSINVDWQAQSTLYFLTDAQEIVYLCTPNDLKTDEAGSVAFNNAAVPEGLRYTTFGTFATQQTSDRLTGLKKWNGYLNVGKTRKAVVKALIEMSTHTMPPLNLLCADFMKSIVKSVDLSRVEAKHSAFNGNAMLTNGHATDVQVNGNSNSDDDDDDNHKDYTNNIMNGGVRNDVMNVRKSILNKAEEISQSYEKTTNYNKHTCHSDDEIKLKRAASQCIGLEF